MDERRRFIRLSLQVKVEYTVLELTEKEIHSSFTKNISGGGICLIVNEELQPGKFLDLKIYLPKEFEPIKALGRVVWSKGFIVGDEETGRHFDLGIEFVKIKDSDQEKISKYIFGYLKTYPDKQT